MKLGHDFGSTPFGIHQVAARLRQRTTITYSKRRPLAPPRRFDGLDRRDCSEWRLRFGEATAAEIGEQELWKRCA